MLYTERGDSIHWTTIAGKKKVYDNFAPRHGSHHVVLDYLCQHSYLFTDTTKTNLAVWILTVMYTILKWFALASFHVADIDIVHAATLAQVYRQTSYW